MQECAIAEFTELRSHSMSQFAVPQFAVPQFRY
jgi:hypothetical protein